MPFLLGDFMYSWLKLRWFSESACGHYEASFVFAILIVTAILSGGRLTDWTGALAVFFTFLHGQMSFDMQDAEPTNAALKSNSLTGCFVLKELLWVATFVLLQAWPLLIATLIFATYPFWRVHFRTWMNKRALGNELESY